MPIQGGARLSALLSVVLLFVGCANESKETSWRQPRMTLWAWRGAHDLRFLDNQAKVVDVAYLARTLRVGETVEVLRRRQPLQMPRRGKVIAVVRIEAARSVSASRFAQQRSALLAHLREVAEEPRVEEVQIDFDAPSSLRDEYRKLLAEAHAELVGVDLSMTALASWCLDDYWMEGLPVTRAIPMVFDMGPNGETIKKRYAAKASSRPRLCRSAIGISLAEEPPDFPSDQDVFVFSSQAWTRASLARAKTHLGWPTSTP